MSDIRTSSLVHVRIWTSTQVDNHNVEIFESPFGKDEHEERQNCSNSPHLSTDSLVPWFSTVPAMIAADKTSKG
jgi:hypothetical protein